MRQFPKRKMIWLVTTRVVFRTYLNLLKVLVFLDIKLFAPIEKVELPCLDECLQTIQQRQFVGTSVWTGIVKGRKAGNGLSPNIAERQKRRIRSGHGPMIFVVVCIAGCCLFVSIRGKSTKGLFRGSVQLQYLPSACQKDCVGSLIVVRGRIKENGRVGVSIFAGIRQQLVEFCGKPMQLS